METPRGFGFRVWEETYYDNATNRGLGSMFSESPHTNVEATPWPTTANIRQK